MPISKNFTSILSKERTINFLQCYPNGCLKYTELCNLMQLAAAKHAEDGGISFRDMQVYKQAWVLSRMRLEIIRLPKWKDTVTVKTWIQSLENSRSTRCIELYAGDEKLAGCETYWAVFNTDTRRPEPLALPHEHFEKFPQQRATDTTHGRIALPETMERVATRTVVLSDLDIVNHANSMKYVEWCLDGMDAEVILRQEIKSMEMNYLKEVALHDKLVLFEKDKVFSIEHNGKTCFALRLEW